MLELTLFDYLFITVETGYRSLQSSEIWALHFGLGALCNTNKHLQWEHIK